VGKAVGHSIGAPSGYGRIGGGVGYVMDERPTLPVVDMRISSGPSLTRVGMPNRSDGDSKSDGLPPILIGEVLLAS
jgi:hypothetical protein